MEKEKKGVWINFTWKRFALTTGVYFLVMTIVSFVFDHFLDKQTIAGYFTLENLAKKFVSSIFVGFFLTILIGPSEKKKP